MNALVEPSRSQHNEVRAIYPVILSGGSGTRLWPVSRAALPKQFLPLTSERTMIQETAARTHAATGIAHPLVVCNRDHHAMVDDQLAAIGIEKCGFILEPHGRNTGPAVAVAAFLLCRDDPDALMLVQPSDHFVGSVDEFLRAVRTGAAIAAERKIVTFGIKPTRAETGFGYILADRSVGSDGVSRLIDRFVEKPDAALAHSYVESGDYLWNSGIFLLSARHFLSELSSVNPDMWQACKAAVEGGKGDGDVLTLDGEAFARSPSLSIDKAVMEHTNDGVVVPVDMDWHDVGSWRALRDLHEGDANGNVVQGDAILLDMRRSYIRSDNRLVTAIGLEDVIVVATEDAILVAASNRASEVSAVVDRLRQSNRPEPLVHRTVHRPWGHYRVTDEGDRFKVKRIVVKPGGRLSLQKHYHRAEHWIVVRGTALVRRGAQTILLSENESTYIPIGVEHRLENPGKMPLHLVEVQTGSYLEEDDIVRLADSYGRA